MSEAFLYEPGTQAAKELIRLTRENVDLRVKLAAERARLDWLMRNLSGRALREIGVVYSVCAPDFYGFAIDDAIRTKGKP